MSTSSDGTLVRRANFLHNTKRVVSDKVQQAEREKKRSWKHPQGTVISVNEVLHHILKYPEVITDLNFIIIQTTSLEARTGKSLRNPDKEKKDNPYGPSNGNQENVDIRQTTNHRENEVKSPNSLRD